MRGADSFVDGFWWCSRCRASCELLEADDGVSVPRCGRCRSHGVSWRELLPAARPARLPRAERDLRVLARSGYFFCRGCDQVSVPAENEACWLCGARLLEWVFPVFEAQEVVA